MVVMTYVCMFVLWFITFSGGDVVRLIAVNKTTSATCPLNVTCLSVSHSE